MRLCLTRERGKDLFGCGSSGVGQDTSHKTWISPGGARAAELYLSGQYFLSLQRPGEMFLITKKGRYGTVHTTAIDDDAAAAATATKRDAHTRPLWRWTNELITSCLYVFRHAVAFLMWRRRDFNGVHFLLQFLGMRMSVELFFLRILCKKVPNTSLCCFNWE
jgi:hypothetical protein